MKQAIYVISAPDQTKVGISHSPEARRRSLVTGARRDLSLAYSAFPGANNARALEKRAHQLLADRQLGGEWFKASAEEAISAVIQAAAELGFDLTDHQDGQATIAVRLPAETKQALEKIAQDDFRTLSSLIEKVLTEAAREKGYLAPIDHKASSRDPRSQ